MGDGMSTEFERFIAERKLIRTRIGRGMIEKEIEAAESDLKDARDSLERGKFKWATIQGYYSMFHGARAIIRILGRSFSNYRPDELVVSEHIHYVQRVC